MIVGIDIGGSTTDAVLLEKASVITQETQRTSCLPSEQTIPVETLETSDPLAAAAGALGKLLKNAGRKLVDIQAIAISGGGSHQLADEIFGVPIVKIPEITAIGVGGSNLARKSDALVRFPWHWHSSGFCSERAVPAPGRHRHRRGCTARPRPLDTLEQLAAQGDFARVDLTVGDIAGGPVGIVPAKAVASHFGKLQTDPSQADKAGPRQHGRLDYLYPEYVCGSDPSAQTHRVYRETDPTGGLQKTACGSHAPAWSGLQHPSSR